MGKFIAMIEEKSSYFHVKEKKVPKRPYETSNQLNDLVKKRKLELDNNEQLASAENPQNDRLAEAREKKQRAISKKDSLKVEERAVKVYNKGFSITTAVDDLIDLNNGVTHVKIERTHDLNKLSEEEKSICNENRMRNEQKPCHNDFISLTMPSPDMPLTSNRQSFIISLSVFKQRQFIRHIRKHLPHAHLVERTFNSDMASPIEQGVMAQSNIASEADVIVSPSTGLIWTTLQKIKQRSLPGQKSQSPTKEKLRLLSAKYDQILVVISKNNISNSETESHHVLDESDCEALADLHGFGAQLDCHLTLHFVPGDGANLFRWVTAVMGKYGTYNEGSFSLLEDESMVILLTVG